MAGFMEIAIAAIGIGVVVMVGYLVVAQVQLSLANSVNDAAVNASLTSARGTIYSGFSLVVIGVIVLAAFGLIQVFRG